MKAQVLAKACLVPGAVSTPAAPGLAVKLVARSAPDLTVTLEAIWAAVRKELWDLPVTNLRRYWISATHRGADSRDMREWRDEREEEVE